MLYTHLGDDGRFEPQRNLVTRAYGLDGGGTIAAGPPGRLMFGALMSRDVQLVAGCAVVGSLFLACGNLLSDLGLAAAGPRLREDYCRRRHGRGNP